MRELLGRFDRSMNAIDRRLEAQAEQMREQAAAMHDMRAQIKANTDAVLHVLDVLRGAQGNA